MVRKTHTHTTAACLVLAASLFLAVAPVGALIPPPDIPRPTLPLPELTPIDVPCIATSCDLVPIDLCRFYDCRPALEIDCGAGPGRTIRPDVFCPQAVLHGASCVAHGLVVIVHDRPGTVSPQVSALVTSRAVTGPSDRAVDLDDPAHYAWRVPDPSAQEATELIHAQHVDVPAAGRTVRIEAPGASSHCEVATGWSYNPDAYGRVSEAYGMGHAGGISLSVDGKPLFVTGYLGSAVDAIDDPFTVHRLWDCTWVVAGTLSLPDNCPATATTFSTPAADGKLTLDFNKRWSGEMNGDGQHLQQAAAVRITYETATTVVDVLVGYSAIAFGGTVYDPV